ncbi:hypothetical protein MLPF_1999 [Mycobacterium lepromatosis]|nr:hypothetical protein MLPF_1999 [Mycobacterium lepromatosis]
MNTEELQNLAYTMTVTPKDTGANSRWPSPVYDVGDDESF